MAKKSDNQQSFTCGDVVSLKSGGVWMTFMMARGVLFWEMNDAGHFGMFVPNNISDDHARAIAKALWLQSAPGGTVVE